MRTAIRGPVLAIGLVVVFAGTAFATISSNFSGAIQGRGTLTSDVHINTDRIKLQTKGDVDFVTATVTIAPNGSSGWHTHPGIVLVSVSQGTLTVYDANCVATVQPAGSSFVESGDSPLLVRNEAGGTAIVHALYLEPTGIPNAGLRIDKGNPGCSQE